MSEMVASCPLCGSGSSSPFDLRQFRQRPVANVICKSCGLVYQSPRMTEAERDSFYQGEYRKLYQGQEGPTPIDIAVQAARADATLGFIKAYVHECTNILDIGCSTGILLQKLLERFQAEGVGIEPGTTYRQYAIGRGLEVYSSLEEIPQQADRHFNLVSMMHVLEHLPNPVEYLRGLREKHLLADGWLLLEVPNLYAHDCFEVAHLVSFSAHTLKEVMKKAGFEVVNLRAHGQPRSQLIPLYLTMLARPAASGTFSLQPDYLVHSRRQAGMLYRRAVTRLFPRQAWMEPESAGGK